ncbi:MAG: AAA family ATPase [Erysipelotrichaceae bacterium]
MLFRSIIELSNPIASTAVFSTENLDVSNRVSERYMDKSRVIACFLKSTYLTVVGYINERELRDLKAEDIINEYLFETKLDGKVSTWRELTISEFWKAIVLFENRQSDDDADNLDFDSDIFAKYIPALPRYNFEERLVKSDAINFEESALYSTAMENEIKRITLDPRPCFIGHPVHYMHRGKDEQTLKLLQNKLAAILYANHRIENLRIVTLKMERYERLDLLSIMPLAEGGTMVIDLRDPAYENLGNFNLQKFISNLVHSMNEFKQKVLFMIQYEDEHDRVISAFLEKVEGFSFVYIQPELMTYAQAFSMLTLEAKRFQTDPKPYTDLLNKFQVYFSESEVIKLFRNLQATQLKENFFPQYAHIAAQQLKQTAELVGQAQKELESLIGLSAVKELVRRLIAQHRAISALIELGINPSPSSLHMVFTGNPGTAKTSVARIIAKILRDEGMLTEGDLIEVGRADLVGEYVGHTAVKVREAFKRAKGSVLFIDEAYSLLDNKKGYYGDEAIATIVQEMENYRNEVVVIFAGYPNQMQEFIERNPGLASRINFHLQFPDYSQAELLQITELIASKLGYQVNQAVLDHVGQYLESLPRGENFGNGRLIRNMVEEAILNHIAKLFEVGKDSPSKEKAMMLEAEDFRPIPPKLDNRITFRSRTKKLN